jgi:hypothetical protein
MAASVRILDSKIIDNDAIMHYKLFKTSIYPRIRPQISECFKIMFLLSCIVVQSIET